MIVAKKQKPAKKLPSDRVIYRIAESPAGHGYEAWCPELVITGFGDTADDAKDMLRRQVAASLDACQHIQALDPTLIPAARPHTGEPL